MTEKVMGYDMRILTDTPRGSPRFAQNKALAEEQLQMQLARRMGKEVRREEKEVADEVGPIYSVNVWYEAAE